MLRDLCCVSPRDEGNQTEMMVDQFVIRRASESDAENPSTTSTLRRLDQSALLTTVQRMSIFGSQDKTKHDICLLYKQMRYY